MNKTEALTLLKQNEELVTFAEEGRQFRLFLMAEIRRLCALTGEPEPVLATVVNFSDATPDTLPPAAQMVAMCRRYQAIWDLRHPPMGLAENSIEMHDMAHGDPAAQKMLDGLGITPADVKKYNA